MSNQPDPVQVLSTDKKRALLARVLARQAAQARDFPLSYSQQRLWFLDQLAAGSPAYNVPSCLRVLGRLDVDAVLRSVAEIVRRHEALRTTFPLGADGPVQRVSPRLIPDVPVTDLQALPRAARETELRRLARAEAQEPFDLSRGPLLRVSLVRLDKDEHVLLTTFHHIVVDGWSMGIFLRELGLLYDAFSHDRPSPLPELPIQYADFARWQREWLASGVSEKQLPYWRQQLAGHLPVLDLPTDRPRPPLLTYHGAHVTTVIPRDVMEALQALSQRHGVTLYMTLLATLAVLLRRHSGQEEVLIGSPIANRQRVEMENLIGFFSNTLVMRLDLSGNPTFQELLERVRKVTVGAYAHQDLPFEQLVLELGGHRDLSRTPVFQVMFQLYNTSLRSAAFADMSFEQLDLGSGTAKFDLLLAIEETADGLFTTFEFNTDLFDFDRVERMASHFATLLEEACKNADRCVTELPLLTEEESRRVLYEWNATDRPVEGGQGVQGCIEAQAAVDPTRVAVVGTGCVLTYGELLARAHQLAHYLRGCGVERGQLVALCVERSPEMVVALLGILEAGAAYVPLDPHYPAARLSFMLADSGATVVVTEESLRSLVPDRGVRIVSLDGDAASIALQACDAPAACCEPDDLAYVIYTSGSTGLPKGVQITHRNLMNLLASTRDCPGLDEADVLVAVTSLSFDIAGLEIFLPLITGASVVIASRDVVHDGASLAALLDEVGATVMQATPATWRLLLATGWPGSSRLNALCGGEAMPPELAVELHGRCASLWNLYGPTETTIWSAVWKVESAESTIPIGRPIANTQMYVLDAADRPTPVGVPGELYIGGVGVADGYLNRPDLTAERFVADPFRSERGGRLYRTGDVARWRADGVLEFLGRVDHQIKLRGFRIELGEIEAVLAQHSGVKQAVVSADTRKAEPRLVAYLVPTATAPSPHALRTFLREHLPDYMIPAVFVAVEELPLTPNGKVDRRALVTRDDVLVDESIGQVAPRDETELSLARLWEDCLETSPIGVHDDFFALGGHSLLAVRLMMSIRTRFGVELPLASLFQASTVAAQAALLRKEVTVGSGACLVPIQPGGSRPPLFFIHPAGGLALCYVELARLLGPDQPFYALQARGLDGGEPPHEDLVEMAAHYLAELREVQASGPYLLGGLSFGGLVGFEMARQLIETGERVDLLALLDTALPGGSDDSDEIDRWIDFANALAAFYGKRIDLCPEDLAGLEDEVQWVALLEKSGLGELLPAEFRLADARRVVAVQRANDLAARGYVPGRYDGRITYFRGNAPADVGNDVTAGWARLSTQPVEVVSVSGDHVTMVARPHVELVATRLRACVDQALLARPAGEANRGAPTQGLETQLLTAAQRAGTAKEVGNGSASDV